MGVARALTVTVMGGVLACGAHELPPLGEAVVVVDTDLPVPRVASALRIDMYAVDGTWLESRSIARRDPRDWPASFSVQAVDDVRERDLLVRVRVHGTSVRDVVGGPRLIVDGRDVTPTTEPEPSLTVDRLILLRLRPGERGRVRIALRASCAGLEPRMTDPTALETCVDGEATREPVRTATLETDLSTPSESVVGSAARTPCGATDSSSRVCIEGGAFVLGAEDVHVVPDPTLPSRPERVARVGTFAVDLDEVTVRRYRDGLTRGFVAPEAPMTTEGALGSTPETACAFSLLARDREDFAMSCISWATARAFCELDGGDLPTEAQWEYAATSASRGGKTMFPWGDEAPDCQRAVYGRLALASLPGGCEREAGRGPRATRLDGEPIAPGDLSAAGVRGLGGGVAEWTRDSPTAYVDACWQRINPTCTDAASSAHVVRGGAWASTAINVRSTARLSSTRGASFIGFRCVYPR